MVTLETKISLLSLLIAINMIWTISMFLYFAYELEKLKK